MATGKAVGMAAGKYYSFWWNLIIWTSLCPGNDLARLTSLNYIFLSFQIINLFLFPASKAMLIFFWFSPTVFYRSVKFIIMFSILSSYRWIIFWCAMSWIWSLFAWSHNNFYNFLFYFRFTRMFSAFASFFHAIPQINVWNMLNNRKPFKPKSKPYRYYFYPQSPMLQFKF